MYDDGYLNVVNVDFSSKAVDIMEDYYKKNKKNIHTVPNNENPDPTNIQVFTPVRSSNGPNEAATTNSPRK